MAFRKSTKEASTNHRIFALLRFDIKLKTPKTEKYLNKGRYME